MIFVFKVKQLVKDSYISSYISSYVFLVAPKKWGFIDT